MRKKFSSLSFLFGIFGLIGIVILFLSPESHKSVFFAGFCLTAVITVIIAWHVYLREGKTMLWNPLFFFGSYTFLADGVPALLSLLSLSDYLPNANAKVLTRGFSVFVALISLLSFWLGYWIFNKSSIFKSEQRHHNNYTSIHDEKPDIFYLLVLIIVYGFVLWGRHELLYEMNFFVGTATTDKPLYLQELMRFFDFSGCFLMSLIAYHLGNRKRMWLFISFLIAVTDIWYAIQIAQKERLFSLVLVILFCEAFYNTRYNLKRQFFIVCLSFIILGVIGPLFLLLRSNYTIYGINKNPVNTIGTIKSFFSSPECNQFLEYLLRRTDETYVVSSAMETFPTTISYQYGKTYLQGIFFSIPFAEKDDPPVTQPNEWGRALGLSNPFDYITGTKVPWFAEGYANFGLLGVIGSSLVCGCLLTLLWRYFKSKIKLSTGLVFYALYYDLAILHTHNGFAYVLKNLIVWALPVLFVVILIKHHSWIPISGRKHL